MKRVFIGRREINRRLGRLIYQRGVNDTDPNLRRIRTACPGRRKPDRIGQREPGSLEADLLRRTARETASRSEIYGHSFWEGERCFLQRGRFEISWSLAPMQSQIQAEPSG